MTTPTQPGAVPSGTPVDAVEFLVQLNSQEEKHWFSRACQAALMDEQIGESEMNELLALFVGKASYIGQPTVTAAPVAVSVPGTTAFLESVLDFKNFKGLSKTLRADFKKQITIVFGANGSGKSSLCEVFKILANHERPTSPLNNVKLSPPSAQPPQFSYKFRADNAAQVWTQTSGFGIKSNLIKYFDSGIALKNVRDVIDPGRVVALAPFKLEIFERVSQLINRVQTKAEEQRNIARGALQVKLAAINAIFASFPHSYFATVSLANATQLSEKIDSSAVVTDQALLDEKKKSLADLVASRSSEGLNLLRARRGEYKSLGADLELIITSLEQSTALQPVELSTSLEQTAIAQELLAKAVIPPGRTAQEFIPFLRAASVLCNLQATKEESCPLCQRTLDTAQVELFNKYHDLLTSDIAEKIATLTKELQKAQGLVNTAKSVDPNKWKLLTTVPSDMVTKLVEQASALIDGSLDTLQIQPSLQGQFDALKSTRTDLADKVTGLNQVIEEAEEGQGEADQRGKLLVEDIQALEYKKQAHTYKSDLMEADSLYGELQQWESPLSALPGLKTRATLSSKEAFNALVVSGFETRMNNEYMALTERSMDSFGVTLSREARQQTLRINPQVGGQSLLSIFSEGEQRSHALALFFAELDTAPQKVIIFDDPSTSFDYNFIAGYCERIRNFIQAHPDKQVIILSHHWEFFVQIQTVINNTNPSINGRMEVQVLENMSTISEYSEEIDILKTAIDHVLQAPSEPTKDQKSKLAANMRRLIESIVNAHVFAKQRHQYKQKSQPISNFIEFTKITPLLQSEAQAFRDLYAKLSITEHNDVRNAYTVIDKSVFQTRYNNIKRIETAIIARQTNNSASAATATAHP